MPLVRASLSRQRSCRGRSTVRRPNVVAPRNPWLLAKARFFSTKLHYPNDTLAKKSTVLLKNIVWNLSAEEEIRLIDLAPPPATAKPKAW